MWESKQEIEKLSAILMKRAQVIEAGKFDPAQAPEIETELGVILLQLEYFEEVAHSVSADTKGVGYVAMFGNRKKKLPSEEKARKISNDIITDTLKNIPAFSFTENGCHMRAHIVAKRLKDEGIEAKKIFAISTNEKPIENDNLQTSSKYINTLGNKTNLWSYHTAALIEVEKEGKTLKYVIDPPLSNHPLTVDAWLNKISKVPLMELKNGSQILKRDYRKTNLGKSTIWRDSIGNFRSNINIYFEADVEFMTPIHMVEKKISFDDEYQQAKEILLPKFNFEAKAAELATFIQGKGVNNLTQTDITSIRSQYTMDQIALCIAKYSSGMYKGHGVEQMNLDKKLFPDQEERNFMKFVVYAISLGSPMVIQMYSNYVNTLQVKAGSKTNLKKFKTDFPKIFLILKEEANNIGKNFEQDLFK
ncbi:hypothetical protein M23134_07208 [Microscilla marina ATCC 23134]|uniref:Protein glutaminase domain-containing protein n=1 Tax=Microscilla marina ATCC 23134 TaxID=313606 RepID=A1ZX38_MICM2|nr:hypothetical protein M23134_07208 [Microscilla marina ATCC 23134]